MGKTAVNINTEIWNDIIIGLKKRGWVITAKYDGFDAGIDDDYLVLKKGSQKIEFGWTNWFEGEIQCNERLFDYLRSEFNIDFEFGEPTSLKPSVIMTYKLQLRQSFLARILSYLKR